MKNKTQKRSKKEEQKRGEGIWGATLKVGNFIASSS